MIDVSVANIVERDTYYIDYIFHLLKIELYVVSSFITTGKKEYSEYTLYVGRSKSPWRRILAHMGKDTDSISLPSALGSFINAHYNWMQWATVEFYTEEECAYLIEKYNIQARWDAGEFDQKHPHLSPGEQALIEDRKPCLNYNTNTYQSPVPAPFEQWRLDNLHKWSWLTGENVFGVELPVLCPYHNIALAFSHLTYGNQCAAFYCHKCRTHRNFSLTKDHKHGRN